MILGGFLYLTIYLYRKIEENNKKLYQIQKRLVEEPFDTEAWMFILMTEKRILYEKDYLHVFCS